MIRLDLAPSFKRSQRTLTAFCARKGNIAVVQDVSHTLAAVFQRGNKVLVCGNGGSCCDAQHFAEEFTCRLWRDRPALPAIALSDAPHLTAAGNDYGFEHIFARGVEAFGQPGDLLVAISTSGNSPNIIRAVKTARLKKMITVGLLGRDGGKMKGTCDFELTVAGETSDRIQEVHMAILHIIIEGVERVMFPENYR